MQRVFSTVLIVAVVLTGVYMYRTANAVCDVPLEYRIGSVSSEFGLSQSDVRAAVAEAEAIWEDATGYNLFTHSEERGLPINFIFDDRQAETNQELVLRKELAEQQHLTEEIQSEFARLSAKYDDLKESYDRKVSVYETKLQSYNDEVAMWNAEGGAPEDVYASLQEEQRALAREQFDINNVAQRLNRLAEEINSLGEEGNSVVSAYNNIVRQYNTRFHDDGEEFTQGDYQGTSINIYQYANRDELIAVLAHELGHALSLGHVEGDSSIMHYLMGGQDIDEGLTSDDLEEFRRICKEPNLSN